MELMRLYHLVLTPKSQQEETQKKLTPNAWTFSEEQQFPIVNKMITHKQENACTEAAISYIRRRYLYERQESPFDTPHPENRNVPRAAKQQDSQAH